tara:strand:- start:797 stop:1345 length:549 start_codon:yes stop_codon:yes gene_type:complete
MSTIKVSTISPLGTDATKTITLGSAGDTIAGAGSSTPAFMANNSADQAISLNTYTKVVLNTEQLDTNNAYDPSLYRFTVPSGQAGRYQINIDGALQSDGTNYSEAWLVLYVNGASTQSIEARIKMSSEALNAGNSQRLSASGILDLSVGDYLEVFGRISSSAGSPYFIQFTMNFSGYRIVGA